MPSHWARGSLDIYSPILEMGSPTCTLVVTFLKLGLSSTCNGFSSIYFEALILVENAQRYVCFSDEILLKGARD